MMTLTDHLDTWQRICDLYGWPQTFASPSDKVARRLRGFQVAPVKARSGRFRPDPGSI